MKNRYKIFLSSIFVILSLSTCACKSNTEPAYIDNINYGYYNKNYIESSLITSSVNKASALSQNKLSAYNYLINLAKNNLSAIPYASRVSVASGKTTAGKLGYATFTGSGLYTKNASNEYYESVTKAISANPDIILPMLKPTLDKAERYYTIGEASTFETVNSRKTIIYKNNEFPYTFCDFSSVKKENTNTNKYQKDFYSLCPFNLTTETVIADSITISDNPNYYRLNFEIDLTTQTARDKATMEQKEFLRETAKMESLEYNEIKISLEIWRNGLPKALTINESWSGDFKILMTKMTISSSIDTTNYYSYHPNDSALNGLVNL